MNFAPNEVEVKTCITALISKLYSNNYFIVQSKKETFYGFIQKSYSDNINNNNITNEEEIQFRNSVQTINKLLENEELKIRFRDLVHKLEKIRCLKWISQILSIFLILSEYKLVSTRHSNPILEIFAGFKSPDINSRISIVIPSKNNSPEEKIISKFSSNYQLNIKESDLILDVFNILQGSSGKYIISKNIESIELEKDIGDFYFIPSHITLSDGIDNCIMKLCEIGLFNAFCSKFIDQNKSNEKQIIINNILIVIKEQLLEIKNFLEMLKKDFLSNSINIFEILSIMENNIRDKLYWMAIILKSIEMAQGGAIIGVLTNLNLHGTSIGNQLIGKILLSACKSIIEMIRKWILEGEIIADEFFISTNSKVADEDLWEKKYSFHEEKIPKFLTYENARLICLTGKALNYLKVCCKVEEDINKNEYPLLLESCTLEEIFNQEGPFISWVIKNYNFVSSSLVRILVSKFHLWEHLKCIRDFFLLGQGDFSSQFIQSASKELDKPHYDIYSHTINGILQSSIQASNLKYTLPEILACLNIILLPGSHGEMGWEIFCLDYTPILPISSIINKKIKDMYKREFIFLFKIKRVSLILTRLWSLSQEMSKLKIRMKNLYKRIHKMFLARNEMHLLISNFNNYIMCEVLGSSWQILFDNINGAKDLEQIFIYHENFLNNILEKSLLTEKYEEIYNSLMKILDLIIRFEIPFQLLLKAIIDYYNSHKVEKPYLLNVDTDSDFMKSERLTWLFQIEAYIQDFEILSRQFYNNILKHPEMNTLKFRLDFNEYYKSKIEIMEYIHKINSIETLKKCQENGASDNK